MAGSTDIFARVPIRPSADDGPVDMAYVPTRSERARLLSALAKIGIVPTRVIYAHRKAIMSKMNMQFVNAIHQEEMEITWALEMCNRMNVAGFLDNLRAYIETLSMAPTETMAEVMLMDMACNVLSRIAMTWRMAGLW